MEKAPSYVEGFHSARGTTNIRYSRLGITDIIASHVGIGGCSAGGEYGHLEEQKSIATIVEAVKSGINYIDTSPAYGAGRSEIVIGKALREIPREAYHIATKVGRYGGSWKEMFDFSAERTRQSIDTSLARLGVDYIDVIQVHDLEFAQDMDVVLNQTLPALSEAVSAGKCRYIGITGYSLSVLQAVVEKSAVRIDMVLSYCRGTIMDEELNRYTSFFQGRGVGVLNASLTGMGLLTDTGPPSWHPAPPSIRQAARDAAAYCQSRGVDFSRLAVQHSVRLPGVAVSILGCDDTTILRRNLSAAASDTPQTQQEQETHKHLMKMFSELPCRHWEGAEIIEYRKALAEPGPCASAR